MLKHHFTVDVEEFFQVAALEPFVERGSWEKRDSRLHFGLDRVVDLLDEFKVSGTFFTLSWIAERHPETIRALIEKGHEVASHGTDHTRVVVLNPDQFRESVRASKAILEDVTGRGVMGYRAPSFSIVPGREWAFDILLEEGYRYDSSLFPISRSNSYGYPGAPRDPHIIERAAGKLLELPPTTWKLGGKILPAAGGGYLRLLPLGLTRGGLRAAEARGQPGMFYIHPWELDPDQPRFEVDLKTRIRHYGRLGRTAGRVRKLLVEFSFCSIAENLDQLVDDA